jgi:hypothetical protein
MQALVLVTSNLYSLAFEQHLCKHSLLCKSTGALISSAWRHLAVTEALQPCGLVPTDKTFV